MEDLTTKALECLEDIYRNGVFISDFDALGKQHPTNISPETNKSISEQCNTIKQALIRLNSIDEEYKKIDTILKLPSENSSVHFEYANKQMVAMQKEYYDKLENAFERDRFNAIGKSIQYCKNEVVDNE